MTAPTPPSESPPALALVLGGGGARAAYEVGVLSAIAERVPTLQVPILTGVSAGAINATYLATHPGPFPAAVAALRAQWSELVADRVYRVRPGKVTRAVVRALAQTLVGRRRAPGLVRGVVDLEPLREFLGARLDFASVAPRIATGHLRAVALSATSYATGDTVTFVEGRPDIPMWRRTQRYGVQARLSLEHLMASCALPILFPAVRIGDAFYGDGSVRHGAPLAPAIHLGARALLAITQHTGPTATPPAPHDYPTLAEVTALLFHTIFLDALEADVERLERINRLIALNAQAAPNTDGLRPIQLLLLRPSRNLGDLARGLERSLPTAVRAVVRLMGGEWATAADFLSYLLFDPRYTAALIELGYTDAIAGWGPIERFLATLVGSGGTP
ncbi:MAG TPA: patatin-like phospholipase family protein [Gemmatimonadales bacterium]|nr:patatin-like phospholipase family protein [Gemmatimonadales bacterium]